MSALCSHAFAVLGDPPKDTERLTRLEAIAHGQPPPPGAPCCPFHATGGHPDDRHGFDPAAIVYGATELPRGTVSGETYLQPLLAQEPRP